MELALIFRRLWALKRTVLVVGVLSIVIGCLAVYRPTLSPPGLEQRGIVFGSASTQLFVDSNRAPLIDARGSLEQLSNRAALYADLSRSDEIRKAIARRLNLRPSQVLINPGRSAASQNQAGGGESRASFLTYEGSGYRVLLSARQELPLLDIIAIAPDARTAGNLADATADSLIAYVRSLERSRRSEVLSQAERQARLEQGLPPLGPPEFVNVRQLGDTTAGLVNEGADKQIAALVTIVAFVVLLVLVLVVVNLREGQRGYRSVLRQMPDATRSRAG